MTTLKLVTPIWSDFSKIGAFGLTRFSDNLIMSKLLAILICLGIIPIIYAQTITDVIPLEAAKENEDDQGSHPDQMAMKSSDASKNINLSDFALPRVKDKKEMVQLGKFSENRSL